MKIKIESVIRVLGAWMPYLIAIEFMWQFVQAWNNHGFAFAVVTIGSAAITCVAAYYFSMFIIRFIEKREAARNDGR